MTGGITLATNCDESLYFIARNTRLQSEQCIKKDQETEASKMAHAIYVDSSSIDKSLKGTSR